MEGSDRAVMKAAARRKVPAATPPPAGSAPRTIGWEQGRPWTNVFGPRGEPVVLIVLAIAVGVIGGLGAIVFRWMIRLFTMLFTAPAGTWPGVAAAGGPWHAVRLALSLATPAVGLVIVSAISHYLAPEVKGHGVPQILEALALRGGRIRPRVAAFGSVSPAITIGSGGSVGQEGPIALIGASFGSLTGQFLRLPDRYIGVLLACGAAAGVAATFNAPIAGAFFGLEVVLGSYAMGAVVPVLVAAVTGSATFTAIMGHELVLPGPAYVLDRPSLLLPVLALGLVTGLAGVAYTRGLERVETLSERWRAPFWVKAALGGVAVGAIGLLFPQVLRVGYETMEQAVRGELPLATMAALLVAKYVATVVTIGAGGSGGVFAPSLFLGTMLGGVFGAALERWAPGLVIEGNPYAVVGMGAIFAGSAQAPLTAITIILEMTGDWGLTLGVMGACAISYFVHGSLSRDSMYTVRLSRRGIVIVRGSEVRPTERITVSAAMAPLAGTIHRDVPVQEAYRRLIQEDHEPLLVVDDDGRLVGVVSLSDLRTLPGVGSNQTPVGRVARTSVVTVYPDDTLERAMRRFGVYDFAMLPVVSREDPRRVVGRLRRSDVLRAYHAYTMHTYEVAVRIDFLRDAHGDQGAFREVVLSEASPVVGRRLVEVGLPAECVVVTVRRGQEVLVPHGDTELRQGDRVLIFAVPAARADAIAARLGGEVPVGMGRSASLVSPPSQRGAGGLLPTD